MSTHFKWYPASEEVVVPFNARYSFPSQANKAVKMTPRIPPKNGSNFLPGQVIRLEFPAQGYVNPLNTSLEFDVTLISYGTTGSEIVRFQNNIQSLFSRVRLLYGSTPLEDMINYNVIVRGLTEWTGTNQSGTMDQTSINEGIGGFCKGFAPGSGLPVTVNARQTYIQGYGGATATTEDTNKFDSNGSVPNIINGSGQSVGSAKTTTRRYQVNFALGLFTQDKLIPTKFMASQLAIEITLENPSSCMIAKAGTATGTTPTYGVSNVNLIPEILEFDASYDAMFLKGLREGGVPIKFSSWHTFIFSTSAAANVNLMVQERSRSVKALFTVQRRSPADLTKDSHAFLFDSSAYNSTVGNSLQTYQYRIGGRYFPAAPVQCSLGAGSSVNNGGAEAFMELQKALNIVGDYRLSSSCNTLRWAVPTNNANTIWPDTDYVNAITGFEILGQPIYAQQETAALATGSAAAGNAGSGCFTMAIDLETSNGIEISGLNAEEQSDIALIANWGGAQFGSNLLEVYTYFDAMIILRENNVLELIQ